MVEQDFFISSTSKEKTTRHLLSVVLKRKKSLSFAFLHVGSPARPGQGEAAVAVSFLFEVARQGPANAADRERARESERESAREKEGDREADQSSANVGGANASVVVIACTQTPLCSLSPASSRCFLPRRNKVPLARHPCRKKKSERNSKTD